VVVGQFEIPQVATTAAFAAAREIGATTILNPAPGAAIERALLAVSDWLVVSGDGPFHGVLGRRELE
jgi:ribokinase